MRHRKSGRKLSRTSDHRQMMLRNMVTSLLDHEKIQTTLAKAKEVRRLADRVIGLARRGDLHARRQALAILNDKGVVKKVFTDIGPRFQDRAGGFTRVLRVGGRQGDAAPMSVVMLTESMAPGAAEKKKTSKAPSKKGKTARTRAKDKEEKAKKAAAKEETAEKKAKKRVKETSDKAESSDRKAPSKKRETKKKRGPEKTEEESQDSS